jgi:hypothetical protein
MTSGIEERERAITITFPHFHYSVGDSGQGCDGDKVRGRLTTSRREIERERTSQQMYCTLNNNIVECIFLQTGYHFENRETTRK